MNDELTLDQLIKRLEEYRDRVDTVRISADTVYKVVDVEYDETRQTLYIVGN